MERLFSPCTRYQDIVQSRVEIPDRLPELNLDVSTEAFLGAERAFTYADLHAMLKKDDTFAWFNPQAVIGSTSKRGYLNESCRFRFNVDDKKMFATAFSSETLLEVCDVILRLLAASVVHSVSIDYWMCPNDRFVNATSLANLLEQCQSLKVLTLDHVNALNGDQIRVLGAFSRPGLEIRLTFCIITSTGASALVEVLGRNQGPTKLVLCEIDNLVLAEGLRGNSRLKSLRLRISDNSGLANREILAIVGALRENRGLIELNLDYHPFKMNADETWCAVCDSLKAHPTLQVLSLRSMLRLGETPAVFRSRIQALVDMLKVNMSIQTIPLPSRYCEHELFRSSVIPYLETNRLRPRLSAIQKSRPMMYRANSLWMFLSGNSEVAFPSTTANLPTPAAAAASNAAATAATAASS
jgi:hypothetical protein